MARRSTALAPESTGGGSSLAGRVTAGASDGVDPTANKRHPGARDSFHERVSLTTRTLRQRVEKRRFSRGTGVALYSSMPLALASLPLLVTVIIFWRTIWMSPSR